MEKLYKIKDAAELLSVTIRTIYRWEDQGKIKVIRVNGNPRISESELKRIMKGE